MALLHCRHAWHLLSDESLARRAWPLDALRMRRQAHAARPHRRLPRPAHARLPLSAWPWQGSCVASRRALTNGYSEEKLLLTYSSQQRCRKTAIASQSSV